MDKNTWVGGLKEQYPTKVYLVYFLEECLYKIGITQRSIADRFARYPPYEIILQLDDLPLEEARRIEKEWLSTVQEYKVLPVLFQSGKTECFKYL